MGIEEVMIDYNKMFDNAVGNLRSRLNEIVKARKDNDAEAYINHYEYAKMILETISPKGDLAVERPSERFIDKVGLPGGTSTH